MRILSDNGHSRRPAVSPTQAVLLVLAATFGVIWRATRKQTPRQRILLAQAIALEEQAARIRAEIAA